MRGLRISFAVCFVLCLMCWGQTPTATISGRVLDPTRAVIPGATVDAINVETNVRRSTQTGGNGLFSIVDLSPGNYRLEVSKPGFRSIVKPDVFLHVQDAVALNFEMSIGSTAETVTVEGGAPLVNTQDASVSTVIDRNFAENLPMNGRSFQTLIQLTPGVVLTPSGTFDSGQFSVNGQRATSNYWTVDGVSANIGVSANVIPGSGFSGALQSFSAQGGTNSLVSVDAMQEFRIQTSTYAPEFGRTPGGQISIVSRSGTNQLHGTLFDYLRNDALDANDWFNTFVTPALPKAKERQNDFGGTLSGPIFKDRAFFFFSYEGLRLRLPQTKLTSVPDVAARQTAIPAMQPFLNAYPLPNGLDNVATGVAQFNASFSNPSSLNAYSLRLDHKLTERLNLFARYNYSPSEVSQRGGFSLSTVAPARIRTQTATAGFASAFSPDLSNDFRFNYSRTRGATEPFLDSFGGAVPIGDLLLPSPYTPQNSSFFFSIAGLAPLVVGRRGSNLQSQIDLVDSVSLLRGSHSLKFGFDFRRLSPEFDPALYAQIINFRSVALAKTGTLRTSQVISNQNGALLFRNLSGFAQDTWHAVPRLTLTYGVRWDVDIAPAPANGPGLTAVTGYNLKDLSQIALAPSGTPVFDTRWANVAPRLGVAWELLHNQDWNSVVRGGFGTFYDLATAEVGNTISSGTYPFGATKFVTGSFPLSAAAAAPPAIAPPGPGNVLYGFDPHIRLPRTLEWNFALEQSLGSKQVLSVSYLGAAGRDLIQSVYVASPNPNYAAVQLVTNAANSTYNGLQLQFQRHVSRGIEALASYTWSHSIDSGSASSAMGNSGGNNAVPSFDSDLNRGSSDFDVRNAVSLGLTYAVPSPKANVLARSLLDGWSIQSVVQARSAPPANIYDGAFLFLQSAFTEVRPDLVSRAPLYLYGPQYPGGKALNAKAFKDPPIDAKGNPTRQGNLGRNTLRGFGAAQWDFAVHRDFPIRESLKLQFRAEIYNLLNHPNFGQPDGNLADSTFGMSSQMLGQSLGFAGGNVGTGAFSPLYQIGGPRSMQFALKLHF